MTEPHPDPKRRWRNRRRMAWLTLIGALVYPVLVVFTDSDVLGEISGPFYMLASAVVVGYLGFATWDDVQQGRAGQ